MRIAVLADMLRPNGAGVMALTQAQLLSRRHDVTLLTGAVSGAARALPLAGVNLESFATSDLPLDRAVNAGEHQGLRDEGRAWVYDRLGALSPDVVMTHNVGRILDQHSVAALSRHFPVGMVLHDEWFYSDSHYVIATDSPRTYTFEPYRAQQLGRHRYDHLWNVSELTGRFVAVAPSRWIQQRFRHVFPTLPCAHLWNPVDDSAFVAVDPATARERLGLSPDCRVIGFIGNPADHRKGFDRLVAMVDPAVVDVVIVIGGSRTEVGSGVRSVIRAGGVVDELIGLSAGCAVIPGDPIKQLSNRVLQLSGVDRALVPMLYAACNLVIHPSRLDNLPTVPIEAGLAGTRCLASDVGGSAESVAEPDSLFRPDVPVEYLRERVSGEMEQVLGEAMSTRELRHQQVVERFSFAAHVPRLDALVNILAGAAA